MSCPRKLSGEYGKPNWNNDKSRTRQHDQCNSNQQDTAADDQHDNSLDRLHGSKPRLVKEPVVQFMRSDRLPCHRERPDQAQRVSDRERASALDLFYVAQLLLRKTLPDRSPEILSAFPNAAAIPS